MLRLGKVLGLELVFVLGKVMERVMLKFTAGSALCLMLGLGLVKDRVRVRI